MSHLIFTPCKCKSSKLNNTTFFPSEKTRKKLETSTHSHSLFKQTCLESKKDNFDQRTACKAHICRSKYTKTESCYPFLSHLTLALLNNFNNSNNPFPTTIHQFFSNIKLQCTVLETCPKGLFINILTPIWKNSDPLCITPLCITPYTLQ